MQVQFIVLLLDQVLIGTGCVVLIKAFSQMYEMQTMR